MLHFFALLLALIPLHGVVLQGAPAGDAIVRVDTIPGTLPSSTHLFSLVPKIKVSAHTGIDGYLDESTKPWTLRDPIIAAPFSPGQPDTGRVDPVDVGTGLPNADLVDQNGRLVNLKRAYLGKTLLLSFVFTRCPDQTLCPAISGKYAYLQSHLDPTKFALVEMTLDPPYDSPAILRRYGAQYGEQPQIWSFLTGKGSTIQRLLDEFGINSLRVSSANFIHNDKLFIVTPQGKVAYLVDTAGWDPEAVIAEARAVAGMANNPFERLKLSLIASVVALCGGSQFAGVVLLEIALFFVILFFVATGLWWVGRVLYKNQ